MPRIRKYNSSYEKRRKKKKDEEFMRSQSGAITKFCVKKVHVSNDNHIDGDAQVDVNLNENVNSNVPATENISSDNNTPVENDTNIFDACVDNNNDMCGENNFEINGEDDVNIPYISSDDDAPIDLSDGSDELIEIPSDESDEEDVNNVEHVTVQNADIGLDIYDPRNWDSLDTKLKDVLAVNGPKRDLSIEKGPNDELNRHFSQSFYTRILPNGEKRNRKWLVYSKDLDKVFCFCCKLFKINQGRGELVHGGFRDWKNLGIRLKEHETSVEHVKNMTTWGELCKRLRVEKAIDQVTQNQINNEKEHWKNVLLRIIAIVKFLGKHNLAFRGKHEKLYESSNGNFLGLVEMLVEFDHVTKEHVRRTIEKDIHFHYLGHNIQNELISLLATTIRSGIIKKIKQAKYFSVILDCTPDSSHKEQMSMILRYVDLSSDEARVEESFLGFLNVNDTSGLGLFDVLQNELKALDLDIDNVRGQGYDNGSNMKGKNQGVQKRFLDLNPRAFYIPCGCHSLNLTLCDIAESCGKARDFFSIIQRIYTIFANSTKRWQVLKHYVKGLTLKSLSTTRWESRVDSVKAIRFQMAEIREALLELREVDHDSKIRSEAKSLARNELGDFEFMVSIVIWFDVLSLVNKVSKYLQSKDMRIDIAISQVKALISCFEQYRENGFLSALEIAAPASV